MSSQSVAGLAVPVRGVQTPRILSVPEYVYSSGPEVVEFCAEVGLVLDPWQQLCLEHGLGERESGAWAAFEVAAVVNRQNGKGEVLMARSLGGLFMLEENLILHTAHEFKTATESFKRITSLIENCDQLRRKCHKPRQAQGQEEIRTLKGRRLRFIARSASSGRGFTADVVILDEAQILTDASMRAILPTMSTIPNPQVWYTATTGNPQSSQLAAVRRRGIAGGDRSLVYLEWSIDDDLYNSLPAAEQDVMAADRDQWAIANPALGIRITEDYVDAERSALSREAFAAERLGVGEWPSESGHGVISADDWKACSDPRGERPSDPVVFAVDVTPERGSGAVAFAGGRGDGLSAVELADHRPGVDWIVDRVAELRDVWRPVCVVVDGGGPAATLIPALEAEGVDIVQPSAQQVAQAAEGFYDAVVANEIRHRSEGPLDAAVAGVMKRPIGEAWAFKRLTPGVDICPLVAASFALWGLKTQAVGELSPDDVYVG